MTVEHGNALFDHVWTPAEVSPIDNVHPTVAGEEMISEVLFDAGYSWGTSANEPPSKNACTRGGWTQYSDSAGGPFKNQGDCVSYVATKGRH